MERKIYSSFEEIDLDLKIIQLEREIHLEKMKRGAQQATNSLKPINLFNDLIGNSISGQSGGLIDKIIQWVTQFVMKSFKD